MNKTMRNAIPALFAALFIAIFATSCNDDNGGKGPGADNSMTDIVTLAGVSDNGFTVTVRKEDDSPLATLTFADQKIDTTKVKVGQRFLLSYHPESGLAYKSGPATAYAYRPIQNAVLEKGTEASTGHWSTFSLELVSLWRTGNFINMMTFCDYLAAPAEFALVVDEATLNSEIPDAYLIYEPDKNVDAKTSAWYATFDINSVWSDPKYRGLRVIIVTHTGVKRTTFAKSGTDVIQPQ